MKKTAWCAAGDTIKNNRELCLCSSAPAETGAYSHEYAHRRTLYPCGKAEGYGAGGAEDRGHGCLYGSTHPLRRVRHSKGNLHLPDVQWQNLPHGGNRNGRTADRLPRCLSAHGD